MTAATPAEPSFFLAQKSALLGASVNSCGVAENWVAPVATYYAPSGFGEEAWLPETTDTVLAWVIAGASVRCDWGPQRGTMIAPSPDITLQPRGAPNHYTAEGPIRFAQFFVADPLLARVADEIGASCRTPESLRPDLISIKDSVLRRWLAEYAARADAARLPPTRVEMEGRALLIVDRLLSHHHPGARTFTPATVLSGWALRRSSEYLRAHLGREVGLGELAATAGLSPYHFARAFKATTGVPPHQYQMRLRLAQAQQLLEETNLTLCEIAHRVGYADQGALTRLFRRSLGTTPSRYRADRRL